MNNNNNNKKKKTYCFKCINVTWLDAIKSCETDFPPIILCSWQEWKRIETCFPDGHHHPPGCFLARLGAPHLVTVNPTLPAKTSENNSFGDSADVTVTWLRAEPGLRELYSRSLMRPRLPLCVFCVNVTTRRVPLHTLMPTWCVLCAPGLSKIENLLCNDRFDPTVRF